MQLIDLTSISVPSKRQRTEFSAEKLKELRESIMKLGLLNPPTFCRNDSGVYVLVAGERRLRAIQSIAKDSLTFFCNSVEVPPGQLPVLLVPYSDVLSRREAELDENIMRVDLSWSERTAALADLHKLRQETNPAQTFTQTAVEVIKKTTPGIEITPGNVSAQRAEISRAVIISKHLDKPEIANARTEAEAFQLIMKAEAERYEAELIRRRRSVSSPSALKTEIRHGDSVTLMSELDGNRFDLILTDPPYGVKANAPGYRSRTVHHHNYDDSEENARKILQSILTDGWRLCKTKANLFIFTDIKHFAFLQEASARMGWTPWRYPVIWQKSTAEGLVPWGRHGFAHTYDIIFFATKGQRGLLRPIPDILNFPRVSRSERTYAAEKPLPLLETLIELSTIPGDHVLDPCAGSGSTLLAARKLQRHSLGIELDKQVCDLATVRIAKGDEHVDFSQINSKLTRETDGGGIPSSDTDNPSDLQDLESLLAESPAGVSGQ